MVVGVDDGEDLVLFFVIDLDLSGSDDLVELTLGLPTVLGGAPTFLEDVFEMGLANLVWFFLEELLLLEEMVWFLEEEEEEEGLISLVWFFLLLVSSKFRLDRKIR